MYISKYMEKFSIVRRRRDCPLAKQHQIDSHSINEKESISISSSTLNKTGPFVKKEELHAPESTIAKTDAISVNLTPEQSYHLRSRGCLNYFLERDATTGVSLDIQQHSEGLIVFNFQFEKESVVRMLTAKQVCQMLQVSNSLLMGLVKSKKIRSYKVGRLRRFFLQDVLDYLSRSGEVFGSSEL